MLLSVSESVSTKCGVHPVSEAAITSLNKVMMSKS